MDADDCVPERCSSDQRSTRPGAPTYRWTILIVTLLAQCGIGAPAAIFVLAVFFQDDLHLAKTQVGLLNSALSLGITISLLASGWIADRLGTRRVLVAGLWLIAGATAAISLTRSYAAGLLLFVVTGIAIGVGIPSLMKSIVIWFPPQERAFATGIMRTGVPLIAVAAAAMLPSLALAFDWRIAIRVLAAVIAVCGAIAFLLYRERPDQEQSITGGTGMRPSTFREVLRSGNILWASSLPAILAGAQFVLASYLILYLAEALDTPVVVAGGILAIVQVGGGVGRVAWGAISDRLFASNRRQVLIIIGTMSAMVLMAVSLLPSVVPRRTLVLLAVGLGLTLLGWQAVYAVLLPELSGRQLAGSAIGVGYTLVQIGAVVGPPLFGRIVDATGDYRLAWRALSLSVAAGIPLMLLVKEEPKT